MLLLNCSQCAALQRSSGFVEFGSTPFLLAHSLLQLQLYRREVRPSPWLGHSGPVDWLWTESWTITGEGSSQWWADLFSNQFRWFWFIFCSLSCHQLSLDSQLGLLIGIDSSFVTPLFYHLLASLQRAVHITSMQLIPQLGLTTVVWRKSCFSSVDNAQCADSIDVNSIIDRLIPSLISLEARHYLVTGDDSISRFPSLSAD